MKLSSFHLEVSAALERLGVAHVLEHLTDQDLLSVDIAIVQDGAVAGGGGSQHGQAAGRRRVLCRHAQALGPFMPPTLAWAADPRISHALPLLLPPLLRRQAAR